MGVLGSSCLQPREVSRRGSRQVWSMTKHPTRFFDHKFWLDACPIIPKQRIQRLPRLPDARSAKPAPAREPCTTWEPFDILDSCHAFSDNSSCRKPAFVALPDGDTCIVQGSAFSAAWIFLETEPSNWGIAGTEEAAGRDGTKCFARREACWRLALLSGAACKGATLMQRALARHGSSGSSRPRQSSPKRPTQGLCDPTGNPAPAEEAR